MKQILYYSTNNPKERVSFETALLNGIASNYGLYMIDKKDIQKISSKRIRAMKDMSYAEIAFEVLNPYLGIPDNDIRVILENAYNEKIIPTKIQHVVGLSYIMWLTNGPTYSFKDYAARFLARTLGYFLYKRGLERTVITASSGDTAGAVGEALHGRRNIDCILLFPKDRISIPQRRQFTTLKDNIYAFEVNGDFDVCQELAKFLLADKEFAKEVFGDADRFTSANSISLGRLLPQTVYPFFAYSRIIREYPESLITSIPSGNFGDMMGTVIAREMGLPIETILVGVNENDEFPEFLKTGRYIVKPTKKSPSTAMNISHPSNLARLIEIYGGHMYDKRDEKGNVIEKGIIDKMPNLKKMNYDIISMSVNDKQHYETMKLLYDGYDIMVDPHTAVAWKVLDEFFGDVNIEFYEPHHIYSVVYATADPGKFPDDFIRATGIKPKLPQGMKKQASLDERILSIESEPEYTEDGLKLSNGQILETKRYIREIFQ